MARRPALVAKKVKKPRTTRSETFLVNKKYLGDEPSFKGKLNNLDYMKALNWYNIMCDPSEAREYMETYLKNQARTNELKKFKTISDNRIPTTAAWIARMHARGVQLPDTAIPFLENKLKESLTFSKQEKVEEETTKVSVQDRMRDKASDIIGEIEALIDSGEEFSVYEWLKKNEIPAAYSNAIVSYYAPWLAELLEASDGEDNQLKEGYRHFTKKQLRNRIEFFNNLIEEAERYGSNTKKARAPRKPRTVSVEKKLKNLKYQKEDQNFKIASIPPEKIVGAQELWTFNTKYKTLTVFRALDRGGLDIKGSSVTKYDENTSVTKRTGRNPEVYIEKVLKGGKIVLRKLMDELKHEASFAHRINESTILLKVSG